VTLHVGIVVLAGASIALAGCANEPAGGNFAQAAMHVGAAHAATRVPSKADAQRDLDLQRAAKQTVSSKMLSAIALERVTGRKPDPSRFAELR
jgi:altronate dehydratase